MCGMSRQVSPMLCSFKQKLFASAAVVLSLGVNPLLAADLGGSTNDLMTADAAPMPAFSWEGAYAGVTVGHIWGDDRTTEYVGGVYLQQFDLSPKGWTGGLVGGYNFQQGNLVFGVEADAALSNFEGGFYDPPGAPPFVGDPGARGIISLDWQASLRLRAGYAFDRVLVFATGGLGTAQLSSSYTNATSLVEETFDDLRHTWTLGAGVEYAITDSIVARLEYRHTSFGDTRYFSTTAFPGFGISADQEPVLNEVKTGVTMKF
jgi:outer membrane immunogenic protein